MVDRDGCSMWILCHVIQCIFESTVQVFHPTPAHLEVQDFNVSFGDVSILHLEYCLGLDQEGTNFDTWSGIGTNPSGMSINFSYFIGFLECN